MDLPALTADPRVARARALVRAGDADTLQDQIRIAAIPAPTGQEGARARYVAERFRALGLEALETDAVGNVLARLPGPAGGFGPVVAAAHLDTVFPAGTAVEPRREGDRVLGPGITDNARGLAALLALARVLTECRVRTRRPLWFAATVGEEGRGDLRGVKHLFRPGSGFAEASAFVALDGSGVRRVVHRAIGSRRLRATVRGPGGHSWSDFGVPNPIHALGRAIARLDRVELPLSPPATLTVARCGGGTSVNAIPAEAWLEMDLRCEDAAALRALEAEARAALEVAVAEASRAGRGVGLALDLEVIGDRPSGTVPGTDPLVSAAMRATRAVGCRGELAASSTDANVPIALGIPAVAIGAGGESGGVHTLEEWYEDRGGARGVERALLLLLAAAGVAGD